MPKNKTAIFTSCAANYIPKARVLGESVKKWHSDIDVYLLAVDTLPPALVKASQGDGSREPFDSIISVTDLQIPSFLSWIFRHRIVEACTAVKPFMLLHLLNLGYERVLYFDPDIAVFCSLGGMLKELDDASVLLTPHLCKPEIAAEAIYDNEVCALKHGVFNFGYVGVANDDNGRAYAKWWAERCYLACYEDIPNGIFTDQKWNDLAPVFFDGVKILRSPAYNVATWNYSRRHVAGSLDTGFTVDGEPLVFHHFTGYDSGAHHAMLNKYGREMPATHALSHWYEAACQRHSQADLSAVPWKYGRYESGEVILSHHRLLYRSRPDLLEAFPNPFGPGFERWLRSRGFWDAPSEVAAPAPSLPLARRSFRQFVVATTDEFLGYVERTPRLAQWQKTVARKTLGTLLSRV